MTPEQQAAIKRAQQRMAIQRAQAKRGGAQGETPSMGTRVKEFFLGDDDPNTQNTGEKIGTAINKAGEALTFGLVGDEASGVAAGLGAAMVPGGKGFGEAYEGRRDFERQQEEVLERDNPGIALGAEIGGSLAGVAIPGAGVGTLARGAGLMPRLGASAAAGGAAGATYGFSEGEGYDNRVDGFNRGAVLGGVTGAAAVPIGGAVQRLADGVVGRRAIQAGARNAPTSEQLKAAGQAAYRQIDDAGVQIKAPAFDNARERIVEALKAKTAFSTRPGGSTLTPNTSAVVQNLDDVSREMAEFQGSALPFKELDGLRRQAGAAAGNVANKSDQAAGMTIIEGLDDFINRLGPDDVVAGDAKALKDAIPKARDLWGRMSRSQLVDDAIAQEGNYVSGGASAIRNQFARILRNDKLSRGFSEAEKKAMKRVVQGTAPEQILNLLGGGLGQLAQIGTGIGIGGPVGGVMGAGAAVAARKGSEAITNRNAEIARALVANGSMRGGLPVASESNRRMVEALMRRTGAVAPQ